MLDFVKAILSGNLTEGKALFEEAMQDVKARRLHEMKKQMMAEKFVLSLDEETLDEARIKIVKARIRGGKIQRRKKVSNVKGFTLRGGQLKRMSPTERRNRKMGQRRGKLKRKSKMSRTLMKRKRSNMKRKAMGL